MECHIDSNVYVFGLIGAFSMIYSAYYIATTKINNELVERVKALEDVLKMGYDVLDDIIKSSRSARGETEEPEETEETEEPEEPEETEKPEETE